MREVAARGALHLPPAECERTLCLAQLKIENHPSKGKDQGHRICPKVSWNDAQYRLWCGFTLAGRGMIPALDPERRNK